MEQQLEPNARVSVLCAAEPANPAPARILAFSGKRMTIAADVEATVGSALKVETYRYIFMGKAVDLRQNGNIFLHIHHALEKDEIAILQRDWAIEEVPHG